MTQLSLLLRSRVFFILLYCLFLWSLTVALVNTSSMLFSVANLVENFAPALLIGAAALGYWFYVTQIRETGVAFSFERPPLSLKLLMPLLFAGSLGAVFVLLTGNRVSSAAGVMLYLFYIMGLIGAVVLSVLKPHLGMYAFLLTLPVALLLHVTMRFQGWADSFSYVAMNPEILLVLVTLFSIMVGLLVRNWRPVRTRLDIPIAVFLLGSVIALFNSPGFLLSSRTVFVGTVIPILCYYLIVNGLRSRRDLVVAVYVLLGTFFLMGSYSLLALYRGASSQAMETGGVRLTQFFVNPGFFAVMLTLILPLPLCLAAFPRIPIMVRFGSGLLFAVLLVALVFTYIRGAWVGFAASLVVLPLLSSEIRRVFLKISPLLLVAFFVWGGGILQVFWTRIGSMETLLRSQSWTNRVVIWRSAWEMIKDNPLTGVGPGMFPEFFPHYQVAYVLRFLYLPPGWDAENLFLNVWAETGILAVAGLTGIVAISLWVSYDMFRTSKDPLIKAIALGLFGGLAGFIMTAIAHGTKLVHVPTDHLSFLGGHTFYLFIVLGLIIAITRVRNGDKL